MGPPAMVVKPTRKEQPPTPYNIVVMWLVLLTQILFFFFLLNAKKGSAVGGNHLFRLIGLNVFNLFCCNLISLIWKNNSTIMGFYPVKDRTEIHL